MVPHVHARKNGSRRKTARIVLALAALVTLTAALALTGCGASLPHGSEEASAEVDAATPGSCGASVLGALGHVECDRLDQPGGVHRDEPCAVLLAAHPGEHGPPGPGEPQRGRLADACRGPRDQRARHR